MSSCVTLHHAEGVPETPVKIEALGLPGAGMDHSHYSITGVNLFTHPLIWDARISNNDRFDILFQNGPPNMVGHNGVTIEDLLAVCAHRLTELQAGPFACHFNGNALDAIQNALTHLNDRTLDRIRREVKNTYQP